MKRILNSLVVVVLAATLFGTVSCISDKRIVYLRGADTAYAVPQEIAQAFELAIQQDDELAISISSKNQELVEPFNNTILIGSGNSRTTTSQANTQSGICYYLVDKDGHIEFPVFGTLTAKGKTCRQLAKEIQDRLISEGYMHDPVVNIKIMSFKVTILGDVKNPGTQTYTGERLTLLEAIGRAGDLNASGKRNHVMVVREENGKRVAYDVDLRKPESVFQSPAYYLQQNDVVYVQPNASVRVKGSPGYTMLSVGATVVSMLVSIVSLILAIKK